MSRYLIDTDWVVDVLRGQPPAIHTLRRIAADGLAISIITYGELVEGAVYAQDPAKSHAGLKQFLEGKAILPLTEEIMDRFGRVRGALRSQGNLIGDLDLLIGVTAVHHELELVTRNRRHFDRIPDLKYYSGSS